MVHDTATYTMSESTSAAAASNASGRLMGFAIIAVLPTVFWTAMVWFATSVYGRPMSGWAVTAIALSIFGLLACVWASFAMDDNRNSSGD
jgi:hypothetical protein